jgi:hypothetical protein
MSEAFHHTHHAPPTGPGHESYEVQLGPVVLFGLGLVIMTGLVFLLMCWLFTAFTARQAARDMPPSPLAQTRPALPPEPRLQIAPAQELQQLRADEDAALHSYGWVDQTAGIVRIPIERALDLVHERGLPVRPGVPGSPVGAGGRQQ